MGLLTVKDVAEELSISPCQVRRIIRAGDLPVIRTGKSARSDRIEPEDVAQYKADKKRAHRGFLQQCQSRNETAFGRFPSGTTATELDNLLAKAPRGKTR